MLTHTFKLKKWAGLWLKVQKDQEQYEKTIIESQVKAMKFHRFSIKFWAKAVLQR